MIDWQLLAIKLQNKGLTSKQVQDATGMCWASFGRLRRGEQKEPRFNTGVRLLDLAYDELNETDFKKCVEVNNGIR